MTVTARVDTRRRAARVFTEASAPAVSLAILLPLVGWHSAGATVNGLLLGLAGTVFAAVVPMTYIVANVRRGRLTDHNVGVREQRRTPLLVGLARQYRKLRTARTVIVLNNIGPVRNRASDKAGAFDEP